MNQVKDLRKHQYIIGDGDDKEKIFRFFGHR